MKILAIDTSTKMLALAIFDNGKLIIERNSDSRRAEEIIGSISRLLSESKIKLSDISGFIVGVGPGSFTGLRVGVSMIKAFSLASRRAVLPISSLDLIAFNGLLRRQSRLITSELSIKKGSLVIYHGESPLYCKNICVIVDAKQEKVYSCLYRAGEKLKRISPYMLCPVKDVIKKNKSAFKKDTLFIGSGIELYKNIISHNIKGAIFAEENYWYPRGEALGVLGCPRFRKQSTKNLSKINPLYLYPKECQIRKK